MSDPPSTLSQRVETFLAQGDQESAVRLLAIALQAVLEQLHIGYRKVE